MAGDSVENQANRKVPEGVTFVNERTESSYKTLRGTALLLCINSPTRIIELLQADTSAELRPFFDDTGHFLG
jgi:hypothetical protein